MDFRTENWRTAAHLLFTGGQGSAGRNGNEPGPGVVIYLLPMGSGQTKGGSSHGWGDPLHSFWCCYGSSVESFSKLADSIFFYRHAETSCLSLQIPAFCLHSVSMLSEIFIAHASDKIPMCMAAGNHPMPAMRSSCTSTSIPQLPLPPLWLA